MPLWKWQKYKKCCLNKDIVSERACRKTELSQNNIQIYIQSYMIIQDRISLKKNVKKLKKCFI